MNGGDFILDCGDLNVNSSPFNQTTTRPRHNFPYFADNEANWWGEGVVWDLVTRYGYNVLGNVSSYVLCI